MDPGRRPLAGRYRLQEMIGRGGMSTVYRATDSVLDRTVAGYDDTDDAVKLIIAAVDRPDSRPIWYADWGSNQGAAVNNLNRTLDRVLQERGPKGYATFKSKLRVICHSNRFGDHTTHLNPPFPLLLDTYRPPLEGKRWYHRFSSLTAMAGGFYALPVTYRTSIGGWPIFCAGRLSATLRPPAAASG